jgi:hypothetical protein
MNGGAPVSVAYGTRLMLNNEARRCRSAWGRAPRASSSIA